MLGQPDNHATGSWELCTPPWVRAAFLRDLGERAHAEGVVMAGRHHHVEFVARLPVAVWPYERRVEFCGRVAALAVEGEAIDEDREPILRAEVADGGCSGRSAAAGT